MLTKERSQRGLLRKIAPRVSRDGEHVSTATKKCLQRQSYTYGGRTDVLVAFMLALMTTLRVSALRAVFIRQGKTDKHTHQGGPHDAQRRFISRA